MKLRYLGIGLALGILATLTPHAAAAAGESVTNFVVTARLNTADVLDVTEQIDYDFAGATPHDITHNLPLTYHDDQGRDFRVAFTLLSVNQDGITITPKPHLDSAAAHLILPAGAGAKPRRYQIHYTLSPVVLSGSTNDILKLAVTGLAWEVPIARATFTLQTPGLAAANLTCYTGAEAGTSSNCTIGGQGDTATVTTDAALNPGEALSVYCDFPPGRFAHYLEPYEPPTPWTSFGLILAIPIVLITAGIVWLLRRPRRTPSE